MKKLDTSACSSTNILYTKSGTFDFLQQAHQETAEATMRHIVSTGYDPTKGYIMYGCTTVAGGGGSTVVLAGAIFFNGEIYMSPQQTVPALSVGQVIVTSIGVSQYTTSADPTDFSDGTPRNVHNIRTAVHAGGASGSGSIGDFSDLIRMAFVQTSLTPGSGWSSAGASVRKDLGNTVTLRGSFLTTSGPPSPTVATLPATVRPLIDTYRSVTAFDSGASTFSSVTLKILASGALQCTDLPSVGMTLYLSDITYRTD